jgi:hypothetical protein
MKMKNIFKQLLILTVLLTGCSDFLEEDNKGGIANDDFYKTETGYQTLITASYNTLRTMYRNTPWLQLAGTDIYNLSRGFAERGLMEYEQLYPESGQVKTFYQNSYNAIQVINMGLYYNETAQMSEATRKTLKAELVFLRAFYHFHLVEQFGGFLINSEATLAPRMNLPRASLADSYQFIIQEMESALPDLGTAKARVNKATANHYLAKVYLTRGWDLGSQADFEKARTYATAAIGGKNITIPFEQLWSPTNQVNDEVIFAVQYDAKSISTESDGNNQQGIFGPYLGGSELNHKYMNGNIFPSWNLHNFFTENDARYEATFMLTIYDQYFDYYDASKDKKVIPIRAYYPRVWGRDYTSADSLAWRNEHRSQIASNFRYYPFLRDENRYRAAFESDMFMPVVKKFDSPSTRAIFNTHASVRDIVLARLAETYFIYAEASIGLNDFPAAAEYVQKVLDRPGNAKDGGKLLPNVDIATAGSQVAALDAYHIETAKEFVGEYNRWPELRRTKRLKDLVGRYNFDVKKIGVNVAFLGLNGQDKIYRPIPQDAINLNEAEIVQNPGY